MTDKGSAVAGIERFLELIWLPGEVRELRAPQHNKYGQTASGYFDSPKTLAQATVALDGKVNLYVTLNPVNPGLLARAHNRVNDRAQSTTADTDILHRRWFFLDVDPVRPSGISSTDEESAAAFAILNSITEFLSSVGWPAPLTAMSGNGYYALYRIDLPNTPETTILIKAVLESVASQFDTSTVHIDTSVHNASRMTALIGTLKRKGDSIPGRPHRRSQLVSAPESVAIVQEDQLRALAAQISKPAKSYQKPGSYGVNRVESLRDDLDKHGIEYKIQPPDSQGFTWYHVLQCPFHDDGFSFECGVGQKLPDGPYAGHCFHPEGTGKGWKEWKEALNLSIGHDGQEPSLSNHSVIP